MPIFVQYLGYFCIPLFERSLPILARISNFRTCILKAQFNFSSILIVRCSSPRILTAKELAEKRVKWSRAQRKLNTTFEHNRIWRNVVVIHFLVFSVLRAPLPSVLEFLCVWLQLCSLSFWAWIRSCSTCVRCSLCSISFVWVLLYVAFYCDILNVRFSA